METENKLQTLIILCLQDKSLKIKWC